MRTHCRDRLLCPCSRCRPFAAAQGYADRSRAEGVARDGPSRLLRRVAQPVLTIDSGDIVRLETATGNPRYFESLGVPKEKIPAELYEVYRGVEGAGRGDHTLNGPIAIRGAEPGDVIEVRIRSVDVRLPIAGQSFVPNRGLLPDQFPYEKHAGPVD